MLSVSPPNHRLPRRIADVNKSKSMRNTAHQLFRRACYDFNVPKLDVVWWCFAIVRSCNSSCLKSSTLRPGQPIYLIQGSEPELAGGQEPMNEAISDVVMAAQVLVGTNKDPLNG